MVPILVWARGSTTRVREGPSASGWPGQSAADAGSAVPQVRKPRKSALHKTAQDCVRTPTEALPIMRHRHSRFSPVFVTLNKHRAMNGGLIVGLRCNALGSRRANGSFVF